MRGSRRNKLNQPLPSFFRPTTAEAMGLSYETLQGLVRNGEVERVDRGLYRRVDWEPTELHSLAAVCARVPESVVCLLSALQVHGIGTRLPAEVWLAVPNKARAPRVRETRIRLVRFSGAAWSYGVTPITFEGVHARVTNPARTVVDCFRYQRRVGGEAAKEALYDALRQRKVTVDALYRVLDVLPSVRLRAALEAMP
jgi:predicted transcriptional regulator of viral defense system